MKSDDIIACALEVGFSISTAYGMETKKLMPCSDRRTLLEFAYAIERLVKQQEEKKNDH